MKQTFLKRSLIVRSGFILLPIIILSLMQLTSCKKNEVKIDEYTKIKPKGPKPVWGPTITPQMQTVIEALDSISPTPLQTLTPQQARMQKGPTDAVMLVMKNFGIATPAMNVDTVGKEIPVSGGASIHARIYTPKTGKSTYPVIVYYHGGGWVIATIDTYNASAQALAELSNAIVVSVEYRKGPEFKFPTAHKDAFDAYKWAIQNASSFKGDSTKMALVGESAGGNLAINTSIMARDMGIRKPLFQLAVYPIANTDFNSDSYNKYANAKPLNKSLMQWFFIYYLNAPTEISDPRISLVNANLAGLPPTTIIGAEIDPLQTEGKLLADKLQAAGVSTTYKLYTGVTHEFFGMASVIPEAKAAQALVATQLINAFK